MKSSPSNGFVLYFYVHLNHSIQVFVLLFGEIKLSQTDHSSDPSFISCSTKTRYYHLDNNHQYLPASFILNSLRFNKPKYDRNLLLPPALKIEAIACFRYKNSILINVPSDNVCIRVYTRGLVCGYDINPRPCKVLMLARFISSKFDYLLRLSKFHCFISRSRN